MKTAVFGYKVPSCPNAFIRHPSVADNGYPLKTCGYDGTKTAGFKLI
jgi:hypothetical protein